LGKNSEMAKIHGLVYIAAGLLVSVLSYKLNYQKLIFFFYAGLVFIFVGISKLIFSWIKNKTPKKEAAQRHQPNVKYCHNCGAPLRLNARFCTRCRAQV